MSREDYLETLLFAFVWNRGIAPLGMRLGKSEDEIADKVLETIDAAADMVNFKLMHERLASAKKRRKSKEATARNKYDCCDCINEQTPLCDICSSIHFPDGDESKPTHYNAKTKRGIDNGEKENIL